MCLQIGYILRMVEEKDPFDEVSDKERARLIKVHEEASKRLGGSMSGDTYLIQRMTDNLEFASGRQWDPTIENGSRRGRPCLVFDKTKKFLDKVGGNYRNNPPTCRVHPQNGSCEITAQIVEDLLRHSMMDESAKSCYYSAGTHQAITGYGFWINSFDYENPSSMNMIPKLLRLPSYLL